MIIQKFGGTSIGTPGNFINVGKMISGGLEKIVILSAIGNTTNILESITDSLSKDEKDNARNLISQLQLFFEEFIRQIFTNKDYISRAGDLISGHIDFLKSFLLDMFTPMEDREVLAQGELISTALMHLYLEENGESSCLLQSLDFMRLDSKGEPDAEYIKDHLKKELAKNSSQKLFIAQGYICRNAFGEIDNLKRGGSDYTASLIGAAIGAQEIQIWTDISGMHNSDPRFVNNTKPIERLSYFEAAELAYFGVSILHPASVIPARKKNIPVLIKNTMKPQDQGTIITGNSGPGIIKAVAAKDEITAIKVISSRMLNAYGFLRKIFEIFEQYKTPVDMISTSEVAVSLTIDNENNLKAITEEIKDFAEVVVDKNQTIICVVGDFVAEKPGIAVKVLQALQAIPLRMISYGGSKHNISILIPSELKKNALVALHDGVFNAE